MPKQPKEKSAHLQELEAVFDRHTRRFSPFDVLGIRPNTQRQDAPLLPEPEEDMSSTHTPVVVFKDLNTNYYVPTHMGVGATHPPTVNEEASTPSYADVPIHDVLLATHIKAQVGKKARQVLAYLNSIRSLERPTYTVPVGYTQMSTATDVHPHYLRRNVLPKLAMIGLIGIVHKSFQGTVYHLHYDPAFIHIVVSADDQQMRAAGVETAASESPSQPVRAETVEMLPSWIDRESWGWLTPELVQQLVSKAGSETQAQEKLALIVYNETHGPADRWVRDRRAVLAHYLRTPQAELWPNDNGFETLALQQARHEHDQALQQKTLAEEALRARQDAAKARFLTALTEPQLQWVKLEAKRRVDTRPEARFLTSRYLLYKAEEEQLLHEWMDRVGYGESVPHVASKEGEGS